MDDENSKKEYSYIREKEIGLNSRDTIKKNDNLKFLLFIIRATLTVAAMALIIFSPFIIYCSLLMLSFFASEIAYIMFVGYLAVLIVLLALIDYVREKGKG